MDIFYALIMGIIQGATEFLPVSSSGHLVLFSRITGSTPSLSFDLVLHLASALAVIISCKKEVAFIVKNPRSKLTLSLVVATIVSALFVFALKGVAEKSFSGNWLSLTFMLSATLLTVTLLYKPKKRDTVPSFLQSAIIGASQGLALFPGLSRSGTVFFAGNIVGLKKESNASFTFLLSLPIIVGSALVSIIFDGLDGISLPCVIVGFISAFTTALLSLKLIKRIFVNKNLLPFIIYLCALSLFLTINDGFLHLF